MLRRFFAPVSHKPTAPPEREKLDFRVDGEPRPVFVRRSAKARRYTLRLKPSTRELVLTMPARGSMVAARGFLERHESWILARLNSLPDIVRFEPAALVPLRGEMHRIDHRPGARGVAWIERAADGAGLLCVAGEGAHIQRRVTDFLKRNARADFERASRVYAARLGVSIKRISIKDTKSRWGSCSAQGSLSYSWRLIMAPPYVLDYLAAHEVTHRREMNHSVRFWAMLREICPDTDKAEAWLKTTGSSLHRYG